jgi:hypothetical protein
MYRLHHQGEKISKLGTLPVFLVTGIVVPGLSILFTLMMEAIRSYETPVLTRATQYHIPEEGNLQSLCS